ncbi:MAG: hypothetical protein PHE82_09460, partial [Syntrophomonadaceae bacterium]|nr:hypothetical protein [Syntrophomonadaceae bacterium]
LLVDAGSSILLKRGEKKSLNLTRDGCHSIGSTILRKMGNLGLARLDSTEAFPGKKMKDGIGCE